MDCKSLTQVQTDGLFLTWAYLELALLYVECPPSQLLSSEVLPELQGWAQFPPSPVSLLQLSQPRVIPLPPSIVCLYYSFGTWYRTPCAVFLSPCSDINSNSLMTVSYYPCAPSTCARSILYLVFVWRSWKMWLYVYVVWGILCMCVWPVSAARVLMSTLTFLP